MIIVEDLNVTDTIVPISEDVNYLVDSASTAVTTVKITMKEHVTATDAVTGSSLVFTDNGASPDYITRDKGSWIDGRFTVGMNVTLANTVSNDGVYVITDLATETIIGTYTANGAIPDTDWFLYETVAAGTQNFTVVEVSPTALRFTKASGAGTVRVWVRT